MQDLPSPPATRIHIADDALIRTASAGAGAYVRQQSLEASGLKRWSTQEKEVGEEDESDERDIRKKQVGFIVMEKVGNEFG